MDAYRQWQKYYQEYAAYQAKCQELTEQHRPGGWPYLAPLTALSHSMES